METPKGLPAPGTPMGNRILPPPSSDISNVDCLYQPSKKRAFSVMSQQGVEDESHIDYGFTGESNQQNRTGSLSRNNVDGTSLGLLKSSNVLEENLINPVHSLDFDGKTDYPEAFNRATSGFKQNGQDVNSTGVSGISTVGTSSSDENQRSLLIESAPTCTGSLKQDMAVAASPRNHGGSVNVDGDHDQMNSQFHGSLQSNEKAGPFAGKVGLAVAEKLWNGSLQLNSSVNITAVAFFKSGEKIPDTKWSESVEVKGKVRLEAFEKYIQDLPRSRNRGLMVISLRLKDGSSEAELARMKEVAKGYKEGKKVGFAQLSPGTDLYICPRSDAIITILAKHGFFKGKAAIEEDHDSFIGCVVWRRKRAASNSAMNKSEKKNCSSSERPPSSPSASSVQGAPEKTSPDAELASKSTDCTTSVNSAETKVIKFRLDGSGSTSTIDFSPVSTVPCSSTLTVGFKASPCTDSKPKSSLEAINHVHRPLSDVKKQHISINDDDDLPEYDFGIPSNISQMRTSNGKLSARGSEQLPPTFSQRRPENVNIPRLPPDAIEKMSPVKRVSDGYQIPALPPEEKHIDTKSAPRLKNLFDDDDDIPEWCPPDHKHRLTRTTEVTTVSASSIAPNFPVEHLHLPRPPYPFYNNPPLPAQPRPHTAIPMNQPHPSPLERHLQKGPRPSVDAMWPSTLPINPPAWKSWRP